MSTVGSDVNAQPPEYEVDESGKPKRVRTLTEKGEEQYESQKLKLKTKLIDQWERVQRYIENNAELSDETLNINSEIIRKLLREINSLYADYRMCYSEYANFLLRTATADSQKEYELILSHSDLHRQEVDLFRDKLNTIDDNLRRVERTETEFKKPESKTNIGDEVKSETHVKGAKSDISSCSRLSNKLTIKAKAEAARVKLMYAEKQAALLKERALFEESELKAEGARIRQKANYDAELEFLTHKMEYEACLAETNVLESKSENASVKPNLNLPEDDPMTRVENFVKQSQSLKDQQTVNVKTDNYINPEPLINKQEYQNLTAKDEVQEPKVEIKTDKPPSYADDLVKFLLRKDLTLSRLYSFNDKPDNYRTWKCSFSEVMKEMNVSPLEEMDLLVKWLGGDSRKYALSIRAANAHDSEKGLKRIWERLDERYGSPEMIHAVVLKKLNEFPKLGHKDSAKLYELSDILSEIESLKEDPKYATLLAYFDSSVGVSPVVNKLPFNLQEKWTTRASNFKKVHSETYPRFWVFTEFIREQAKIRNDPGFVYSTCSSTEKTTYPKTRPTVASKKTDLRTETEQTTHVQNNVKGPKSNYDPSRCPIHKTKHTLNDCRAFMNKSIDERKKILKDNKLCFKCCMFNHVARDCRKNLYCNICGKNNHVTAMHITGKEPDQSRQGGEETLPKVIASKCTEVCGNENFQNFGKSCAKLVLVKVYQNSKPDQFLKTYAILDDQSNRSLASPELFSKLKINSQEFEYTLKTCSDTVVMSGRRALDCKVESLDGSKCYQLPTLIECTNIPDLRDEIPTPQVALYHDHLRDIACQLPELDEDAGIRLLIGRDLIDAHHVIDQKTGPPGSPYAQRLGLGWVVVGEVCLGKVHQPDSVVTNKTYLVSKDRASVCQPCPNGMRIRESGISSLESNLFVRTTADEEVGLSVEDREFMQVMNKEFRRDSSGNWIAPLPFKPTRQRLPNNREQALHRARILDTSLKKNPLKKDHFVTFMAEILENGHAERASPLEENTECWYLPLFGVYHPKKPTQIRGVFDASAKYQGVALNDVLLSGPDLTNSLLGVLLRFRKEPVAMTADVQKMFYCFLVEEQHRDFLRFFWYSDNNPDQELVEYRMRVHVFGNKPSPSVASYGLQKIAEVSENKYGADVQKFIAHDFYVDDGLTSTPTVDSAVDLMKRTQQALQENGNVKLHKIASNSTDVMQAFPAADLAKDLAFLDLSKDDLPMQRSLGLCWDLEQDSFTFQVSDIVKPYTRRGVLSTVNSIYDPLGLVAPAVVTGKLFLRDILKESSDWDAPMPEEKQAEWESWRDSLVRLEKLSIPRCYFGVTLSEVSRCELHIYSDASEQAIAAAAYSIGYKDGCTESTRLVLGKAKVAPKSGHTIPRLELCAAVLAVEVYRAIHEHLELNFEEVRFFTDSKVVLGYIKNRSRRFYTYVSNRVAKILHLSKPEQWFYVNSSNNPADSATRPSQVGNLTDSTWIHGPDRTPILDTDSTDSQDSFPLVSPEVDKEVRPEVDVIKTRVISSGKLGAHRFERISEWRNLVEALEVLLHVSQSFSGKSQCRGWHVCSGSKSVPNKIRAEQLVIKTVQEEVYSEEIISLQQAGQVHKRSSILSLNPFIDKEGLLRVGGRLKQSCLPFDEKHPVIIPRRSHLATLLIRHYHDQVKHQGRHITEGAIRSAGFWIVGGKRHISSIIHQCVKCRKLRSDVSTQKMSDLPTDRVHPTPPFTYVGIDTFGPWDVVARRTRGGQACSKRWAILFTCLTCRAVHIEVVDSMSSSAFINAFRRFIAIRGDVKEVRSDQGTNFIGATDDLSIDVVKVGADPLKTFLHDKGITWIFNPPHSSHMGGVWERMIGVTRRILDSMLSNTSSKHLTHEVLTTLMAEVTAIINARPLVPVSSDHSCPEVLSPAVLLTQKQCSPVHFECQSVDPRVQWKYVQSLADTFWKRWRTEFLYTLQQRRKWKTDEPNLKIGDVVLLREKGVNRNSWPLGIVLRVFQSEDGRVRKGEVRVVRGDKSTTFIRPISELILLVSDN